MTGLFCLVSMASFAQQKIDLETALQEGQVEAKNRSISPFINSPGAVEMNADEGDGLPIWLGNGRIKL